MERTTAEPGLSKSVDGGRPGLWFLDHAPVLGGAERFVLKLAAAASNRTPAFTSVMVCPIESELAARGRAAGFAVHHADFPSVAPLSPRAPAAVLALHRALAQAPASAIVIANSARAQAYAAAANVLARQRYVVVNVAHEQDTAARGAARAVLQRSGVVVAVGANNAEVYARALPGVGVQKINNVLDETELESAIGARARAVRLAVLARMIPEKGIIELLDEVHANSEQWSTLAIGAPPQDRGYEARVRRRIDELGLADRVFLHGSVCNVSEFLDGADLLVVPSTSCEGQPTVIIEALARGVPALVREPILSEDFSGLPVRSYRDAGDFGTALSALRPRLASMTDMRVRFGPDQALEGLLAAARQTATWRQRSTRPRVREQTSTLRPTTIDHAY